MYIHPLLLTRALHRAFGGHGPPCRDGGVSTLYYIRTYLIVRFTKLKWRSVALQGTMYHYYQMYHHPHHAAVSVKVGSPSIVDSTSQA